MKYLAVLAYTPLIALSAPDYYQCTSEQGVTFSQFPCKAELNQEKRSFSPVNTSSKPFANKKTLTEFTTNQRVNAFDSKIKGVLNKINSLKQERFLELEKLNSKLLQTMNSDEKKVLLKEVKEERKRIKESYKERLSHEKDKLSWLRTERAELKK
ncbi:hypothetical protein [Pseudoalteromonas sp. G4]|uniref:hypothetical protein n=1 Tax=Pseudoalteromonas sp. G4 TaxID=2992761 RepID=UPI00237EA7EB|nr:hypothetical protein [Pseudoalteromonas sp. G4]MDE3273110.1 hypothetical protein [Pseudoalteromonas sp. G4]